MTPAPSRHLDADVAVVGGGLAGLTAARRLASAGVDVVVLEGRDRVGGRTLNLELADGEVVEVGGQWVGPTQDRVLSLVAELGIETFPTYCDGRNLLELGGRISTYTGTIPRVSPVVLVEMERVRRKLSRMQQEVPLEAPWTASRARELDSISFSQWMSDTTRSRRVRDLFRAAAAVVWGADPSEFSLLWALFYMRSAGGLDALLDTRGGAQQDRVVGGSQEISIRLCDELGERVVTGTRVTRICQDERGVSLDTSLLSVRSARAVIALPPPMLRGIDFDGSLGLAHGQLAARMPMGAVIKATAVYPTPFWRQAGLSGEAVSDRGPVCTTFDNSPYGSEKGAMLGFIGASQAAAHSQLGVSERRRRTLEAFARLYGEEARHPLAYHEQVWAEDELSGGGPVCSPAPGALSAYGDSLRAPAGRLHWAGSETSTVWAGYMDGAVRSGERAADEIVAAMN